MGGKRRLSLKKTHGQAQPGQEAQARDAEPQNTNTDVSFLNLLGVCGSENKDKGSNDYSVKSMVLDFANTN